MRDRFGNVVLQVGYSAFTPSQFTSITLNPNTPESRTIDVTWDFYTVNPPGGFASASWPVISQITFPTANGLLTATFNRQPGIFRRAESGGQYCTQPGLVAAPALSGITFTGAGAGVSYSFAYFLPADPINSPALEFEGVLTSVTLLIYAKHRGYHLSASLT